MSETRKLLLQKLGIRFKQPEHLELALTHRSFVHEKKLSLDQSNERLEFLGDAVLGLCISEMLVHAFPREDEGTLSKRRAALVNQKQLARLAESVELGPALKIGKGEEKTGGRKKKSLLCDAFEAVVGAYFLDQGLAQTQKFLERVFVDLLPDSQKLEASQDYKTKLQEHFQSRFRKSPRYSVLRESGPDHSKTFEVKIEFGGESLATGQGSSKRSAEQDAARQAYLALKIDEIGPAMGAKRRKKKRAKKSSKNTRTAISPKDKDREKDKKSLASEEMSAKL
ncbi:MAG: ribonuclease III [Bradymonadales bacterium]|nr:MAG: ribonuclease III [Bradymonadales bacterium]